MGSITTRDKWPPSSQPQPVKYEKRLVIEGGRVVSKLVRKK